MVTLPPAGTSSANDARAPMVVSVDALPERHVRDLLRELPASAPRIRLAWLMLLMGVVLSVAMLAMLAVLATREGFASEIPVFIIWGPLFCSSIVTGLLILHRYPGHRVGWVLCLAGFTWITANTTYLYGTLGLGHSTILLPAADIVAQIGFYYPFGLYLIVVELLLIFPTGHLVSPRWQLVRCLGALGALGASLMIGFGSPLVMNGEFGDIPNPWHRTGIAGNAMSAAGVGFFLMLAMGIPAGISMVRRLRRATGVERMQLRWIALASSVLVVAYIIHVVAITNFVDRPWFWIIFSFWGLALNSVGILTGIAILRYRLYDIDIAIHRSVLYACLIAIIALLYLVLINLLELVATQFGSEEPSPWLSSMVVASGIALAVHPVRQWLEGRVNRRLYGERDNPDGILARLGVRLETAVAPAEVLREVTDTVRELLRLPHAAVALREENGLVVATESGIPGSEQLGVPMIYQHEPIGELRVTPRGPGEGFSEADTVVLERIARQTAIAAYALRVTGDLQLARARLVTTREEERRRLRRDLHDGLGAQLAALTMQTNGVRRLLHSDPERADIELATIQAELRGAIGDIRRLVHDLRPPALDEFGLVAALRSRLVAYESDAGDVTMTLHASGNDAALPAAVEVAVYRIVQEALTNIERHAGAGHVRISLDFGREVNLTITDDGRGIPATYEPGVGIHSMRERTEELGGTFTIGPAGDDGTRIAIAIPLPETA
ncbi:MAG: histidine kinase [Thermomicrobiales bacterium]|nr:histidine kinase [Thermomicrobiales bacterium]